MAESIKAQPVQYNTMVQERLTGAQQHFFAGSKLFDKKRVLAKRLFDGVISLALFILCLPFILLIAVLIRLDTPGNPFFLQSRVGQHGRAFTIFKFRTLYIHHFGIIPEQEEPADYRITPVGRYLRRTKLDELPQLLNILLGDMSFVGPRPYTPNEFDFDKTKAANRLLAKPGLTGVAQVSGNISLGKQNILWADAWYIQNYSFRLDMQILLYTFGAIRKGEARHHDPFRLHSLLPVKPAIISM